MGSRIHVFTFPVGAAILSAERLPRRSGGEKEFGNNMNCDFIISCESTVDMPYEQIAKRGIPVLFYSYMVDGVEYPDDMGRNPEALPGFYRFLQEGKMPTTSQLNEFQYESFFEPLLQRGDVLHIAFGSGMTGSVRNAQRAAQTLGEKYPQRKLIVIDSLCSSSGYGLLVELAADMRDRGCSMEEIRIWVEQNKGRIHHQFFSTDLTYFRRSGRISGPAAMLGAVLNICPIMRLDDTGHIIAYDKVRGKKRAIARTVQTMEQHAENGASYSGKCCICHANCLTDALELQSAIREHFPEIHEEIKIYDIGTIIASHCGPGTVAVFFLGDEREAYKNG